MTHPALQPEATAVVTGGAAGIGLAAALRFAQAGLNVVIADLGPERLAQAADRIAEASPRGAPAVMAVEASVARAEDLDRLETAVADRFGATLHLCRAVNIPLGLPPDAWTLTGEQLHV